MAYVEYAFRDDPYTIALLEDAGRKIKDCCQIMTFGRHLVKPEIMGQYLFFFPYAIWNGHGKYHGDANKLMMLMEDHDINPEYNYVAVIESQVEFQVRSDALKNISQYYAPAWNMRSYLNYFSDIPSGVIFFLRVFRIDTAADLSLMEKGSKGSVQVFRLYDRYENETSAEISGMTPVISDNRFQYLKDEIISDLKVDGVFIAEYSNTDKGKSDLQERLDAAKALYGEFHWGGSVKVQALKEIGYKLGVDEDFDMAQLDYDAIFDEAEAVCPAMKGMLKDIRNIQAARLGEYDYNLEMVHKRGPDAQDASLRIFDMVLRSCVKVALYAYKDNGMEFEDAFQEACIGAWTAIWKHSDSVEGLFPSYASMWMSQVMHRDLPYLHQTCYVSVHTVEQINQYLNQIEKIVGPTDFNNLSERELHDLLKKYTDWPEERITQVLYILLTPESIETLQEETDGNAFVSDENVEDDVISRVQSEQLTELALRGLSDRERSVIEKRYGLADGNEHTLEEIGQEMSVTRERVRQIESKAKKKIAAKFYANHVISHARFISVVPEGNLGRKKK
ncbi:hypothetical protein LJ046_06660 [Lactobacillus delbrueckii subsp. jakobsenii ZN7a-9 = DSM 26046]|uniref:sigma-70 family RNA polymerase sigma factor n=1 Tax=Lactobacillus delbrueckii TaxID=1584 RepID=UPI00032DA491|nr:sigma-70 family RNA polymerase sigma factor [Lactobacillus delbrueckii]APG73337.1 hypothetical protein LJ046_06660 [Lactobacillus delbrueckii subsp. jakobsenii ZN7a-9 = DSM 26046]EOD03403.1 RpoD family RNA polymerase sigma factor [Lactobacillus delbrueckii subsp. jakobsenii ZN7a-9 = DSM 26046]KRO19566.1 hypothetical protein IV58_GL001146 [Lactobacillus delbrueckii subsp. jakobsenii ZN7a-9 = DSM 26046]TDG65226.1 hypothetical protein C5L19_000974 [Lactobacillus delbrueckii subsp. jakobsenii]